MRKIFSQRARVVVYLENESVDRMLEKAREEGKTLVEWARETLLEQLADNSDVPRTRAVRVAGRRAHAAQRLSVAAGTGNATSAEEPVCAAEDVPLVLGAEGHAQKRRTCKHGIEKGWRCWQCGGMAVIE